MDGASDQFNPVLIENGKVIEPAQDAEQDADYILDRDLADKAIGWIEAVNGAAPDKPFLLYLAPGTGHEPHQAPAEWLARFRGKFDHGWDVERARIFARQKRAGIIPRDAKLTPRPEVLPAWDSLSPDEQRLNARLMEAFAAMRAHFDHQFGRIVQSLKDSGEWDNTLVIFIDGDNGSSGEGGLNGTLLGLLNRPADSTAYKLANEGKIGGPFHSGNYSAAWGWALDAPFPWFKQHASHLGGTRAGMVVSWPARIKDGGAVRSQYGHVNDIAATLYEAAGVTPPEEFAGVRQMPLDGTSLVYSFTAPKAPPQHRVQYYEMLGNRAIYKDGWQASLSPPNVMFDPASGREKHWELFNLDQDYSQSTDLAARYPEKLAELRAEQERQTAANGFAILDAPIPARANPAMRPDPFAGNRTLTYRRGEGPMIDRSFPEINNRSWSLTVPVTLAGGQENGAIISQGGYPFGWGLYLFDGKPTFLYVNEPEPVVRLESAALAAGAHVIAVRMVPLAKGLGGPARITLAIDSGEPVAIDVAKTVPLHWGANGVGFGREVGTAMLPGMTKPFAFTGEMGAISLTVEE